jgi:integrase
MKMPTKLSFEQQQKYSRAIRQGYFRNYDENPREWRHSFVGMFLQKHPKRVLTLDILRDLLGHIPEWKDFDDMLVRDFVTSYSEGWDGRKPPSPNSVRTICAELRATLNECVNGEVTATHMKKDLAKKSEPSQAVFLTETEILEIESYVTESDIERYAKKIFLIEAYTGARACDSVRLTPENCDMDTNTLSYVSQKTKTLVTVPIHHNLMKYLSDPIKRDMCLSVYEDAIRRICRKCGIDTKMRLFRRGKEKSGEKWRFVTSHTARRSFATNLFLRRVDPPTIAQFMGHASPDMTIRRYIIGKRDVTDEALAFFKDGREPRWRQ